MRRSLRVRKAPRGRPGARCSTPILSLSLAFQWLGARCRLPGSAFTPAAPLLVPCLPPGSSALEARTLERFAACMDTSARRLGSFSADQEHRLEDSRRACADMLTDTALPTHVTAEEPPLKTASVRSRN
jgi:hypothetical protein